MKTSESIKELAGAMNKAQRHMTAAKKDSANPFFKSKYADLGSVILALKEAFAEHGLSYTQAPIMQENLVGVTTRIMHESGEWLEETLLLPLVKMDPQAAGSAITYARRYALQSMAGIPAADDDAEFAMGRNEDSPKYRQEDKDEFDVAISEGDALTLVALMGVLDHDAQTALHNSFEDGAKSSGKDIVRTLTNEGVEKWNNVLADIETALTDENAHDLADILQGMTKTHKRYIAKRLGDNKSQQMGALMRSLQSAA